MIFPTIKNTFNVLENEKLFQVPCASFTELKKQNSTMKAELKN